MRARGDAAVLEYTARFDRLRADSVAELEITAAEMRAAFAALPPAERAALEFAAGRVRAYHERQKMASWSYREPDGSEYGQQVTPLDRVGVYVPGGKAAYPSSVLMNVIPAHVAGVAEIVMVVPTPDGVRNPLVLAAAHLAGVSRAFAIGGAQAIAALAYGTATIPAVDKICGPGNAYVAAAKRRVFGAVGIDMVAGVSEILVIADASADPDWVAMDLFSQAEHDELAQAILVSPDAALLDAVAASARRQIATMPRRAIIAASFAGRGAFIAVRDLDEACAVANRVAPEHLELAVADPAGAAAEDPPRRGDLHGARGVGGARRLLRRSEPRAADRAHRALLVAARRLRLPEALVAARHLDRGRAGARSGRGDAGRRRRPAGARAERALPPRARSTLKRRPRHARPRPLVSPIGPVTAVSQPPGRAVADVVAATVRPEIRALTAYVVARADGMIKLDAMENPFALPDRVRAKLAAAVAGVPVNRYPDGGAPTVRAALRRAAGIPDALGVLLGNGSDELIQIITSALARPGAAMLAPEPSFVMYRMNALYAGMRYVGVPLRGGLCARHRGDAGGDRAGASGAGVPRLPEQSDRQPVRGRRRRAHHRGGAGAGRRRRGLLRLRRRELPAPRRRVCEPAAAAHGVQDRDGRAAAGLRGGSARVDRRTRQGAPAV